MEICFFIWLAGVIVLSIVAGVSECSAFIVKLRYGLIRKHNCSDDIVCIAFWFIIVLAYLARLVTSWVYLCRRNK